MVASTESRPTSVAPAEYCAVRDTTMALSEPLEVEDHVVQSMPDVSPPKWHLAHTTWFFETFVLSSFVPAYEPVDPNYRYLFNSYYTAVGPQHPRAARGHLARPTLAAIRAYRSLVDARMQELLSMPEHPESAEIHRRVTLGLQHEQQHQELMLMDIKHNFFVDPVHPAYRRVPESGAVATAEPEWIELPGGVYEFGHDGEGFAYDNESPRHAALLQPFALASRCVTNAEYMEFMNAGGYERPEHWLADGWAQAQKDAWEAPLYWKKVEGRWHQFTLSGLRRVDQHEPVVHVSFYEADAFARWRGARLPTEFEWERAAQAVPKQGNFVESGALHPRPATGTGLQQMFGDVWEVTRSDYGPYPGYRVPGGALGEYNGKFMCGQYVQRGGSCVSARRHIRSTYRNYFYPHQRWNFQGVRLARDAE